MTRLLRTLTVGVHPTRGRDFLRGAASIMDLRGNTLRQYRLASTASEANADAIAEDWRVIGGDMRSAIDTVRAAKG